MRALDYGPLNELRNRYGDCQSVHPMPDPESTRPAIIIRPHRDTARAETSHAGIANVEEV
jgi:anaerobic dimethyl sulfoxide reductase subunit B (iron-sulfur subunit)